MMIPSDHLPNKKSVYLGEATIYFNDSKIHRKNDTSIVRLGYFWYWFRKNIILIAVFAFLLAFFIPYFLLNTTDGYILCGGSLSLVFCFLATLSYIHIIPWRRHPSSLLIQVCGMSGILSFIAVSMAFPDHGDISKLNDGSDMNLIGSNDYNDRNDHTAGCVLMSFFLQLTLFAREMWILTLSLDLLTNITNPFASYKINLRKYHLSIWSSALLSAILLISGVGDCQGEFLDNGTCWMKISSIDSVCFWTYFMAWLLLFYANAGVILSYAFSRISKGLESTYATHYSFVVDTFRIVFCFFLYGAMLAGIFLVLYYATSVRAHEQTLFVLEHLFAFFIASRGFFDALIWFFTHGFIDDSEEQHQQRDTDTRDTATYSTSLHSLVNQISNRRLTISDIFKPKLWCLECYKVLTCCLPSFFSRGNEEEEEEDLQPEEESEPLHQAINGHCHGEGDVTTILLSTNNNSVTENSGSQVSRPKSVSSKHPHSWTGEEDQQGLDDLEYHGVKGSTAKSPTGKKKKGGTMESSHSTHRPSQRFSSSNIDHSPQLNLALRAEVLYVVTLGIKESVNKLHERERKLKEYAQELILQEQERLQQEALQSNMPGLQPSDSNGNLSNLGSEDREEFVRIRLSSNSAASLHHNEVSNILRDIYATPYNAATTFFGAARPSNITNSTQSKASLLSRTHQPPGASVYGPPYSAINNQKHSNTTGGSQHPQKQHGKGTGKSSFHYHASQNHSYSYNPQASMAIHSLAANSILHSLLSLTGTYLPGEYGVDHMNYLGEEKEEKSNRIVTLKGKSTKPGGHSTSASLATSTVSQLHPPQKPDENKTVYPFARSNTEEIPISRTPSYYLDHLERYSKEPTEEISVELPPPPAEVVFNVNEKYRFRDFRPATFRQLRQMSGMTDEQYLAIIAQPTQEKLSEGRSGAFFFVCGEGDLVVKTVESHEAQTLLSILDQYIAYLLKHPESLLVRFLGLHSIRMYGNEFTFVVMKNIFPKGIQLNEKYDIKGSYVQRNSSLKIPGKLSTCRYCHEQFIEGSNDHCSEVIGGHEAIITLKDNDMITKIRLYPGDAYHIIDTLYNDSDALCSMGLMDYSLLVGVKHGYYDVDWFRTTSSNHTNSNHLNRNFTTSEDLRDVHMIPSMNQNNKSTVATTTATSPGIKSLQEMNTSSVTIDSIHSTPRKGAGPGHNLLDSPTTPLSPPAFPPSSTATTTANMMRPDHMMMTESIDQLRDDSQQQIHAYAARAVIAPKEYYFGVIDILQTWSWTKKLERFFKVHFFGQPADGISAIDPKQFKERFQRKISRVIEHEGFVREVTGSWCGKREIGVPFTLLQQPPPEQEKR